MADAEGPGDPRRVLRADAALVLRSLLYNVLFYLIVSVLLVAALPTLVMPRRAALNMARVWGSISMFMLQTICGTRVEFRGRENLPPGPVLIAAKHQSAWDTFALLSQFRDPTFVLKRELMWVPFFGWTAQRARMIPVERGSGPRVLAALVESAREAVAEEREIVIFPEGTRRAPGAPPDYKFGIAPLYAALGVPCVPLALNSGLFWPRRSFLRMPGTIVVEFLKPIPPGLSQTAFFRRMRSDVEGATAALVAEGEAELSTRGLLS